jgi:hypothetical protein
MTAREALEQATAVQSVEGLHRFETICGLRGGCEREPLADVLAAGRGVQTA